MVHTERCCTTTGYYVTVTSWCGELSKLRSKIRTYDSQFTLASIPVLPAAGTDAMDTTGPWVPCQRGTVQEWVWEAVFGE